MSGNTISVLFTCILGRPIQLKKFNYSEEIIKFKDILQKGLRDSYIFML
jgi:hypothetical protein